MSYASATNSSRHCMTGCTANRRNLVAIRPGPAQGACNLNACLWNARSICNKALIIRDMILEDALDFFALTETWLQSTNSPSITDATPSGFSFFHTPRAGKTGG